MTNTVWTPSQEIIEEANLTQSMRELNFSDFKKFHQWSTENFQEFWRYVIHKLKIVFQTTPTDICDLSAGIESPCWFPQAKMNIAESCFTAPKEYTALLFQQNNQIQTQRRRAEKRGIIFFD